MDTYGIELEMSTAMSQSHIWDRLEMYGLPLVDDEAYYRTDKYDREEGPLGIYPVQSTGYQELVL